jgi:hypothetical protein
MGSKIRRVCKLREKNFDIDYLEIGFSKGSYLRLKIAPSINQKGSIKTSIYLVRDC